jgi:hypothetical protein
MKRSVILSLACAALLLSGCDFMRTLAGRPTSADLEAKRVAIRKAREEARRQAVLDSLERVRKHREDSLAALEVRLLDSLAHARRKLLVSGLNKEPLETKYCIIVASYGTRSNAEAKVARCLDAGYPASVVPFRSGLNAVGVCPSDSINVILKRYRELTGNGICPPDGWILVNE